MWTIKAPTTRTPRQGLTPLLGPDAAERYRQHELVRSSRTPNKVSNSLRSSRPAWHQARGYTAPAGSATEVTPARRGTNSSSIRTKSWISALRATFTSGPSPARRASLGPVAATHSRRNCSAASSWNLAWEAADRADPLASRRARRQIPCSHPSGGATFPSYPALLLKPYTTGTCWSVSSGAAAWRRCTQRMTSSTTAASR